MTRGTAGEGRTDEMRLPWRMTLAVYYAVLLVACSALAFALWPTADLRAAVASNPSGAANLTATIPGLAAPVRVSYDHVLLALAFVAGALGSLVHGITSLARYRGSRKLYQSWFLWYLSLPPVGALLGAALFALLGGGLLVLSGNAVLNAPSVLALGFLSGMFSKDLIPKLGEIFGDLLATRQKLPDRLDPAAVLTRATPGALLGGGLQEVLLEGKGFQPGAYLRVDGKPYPLDVRDEAHAKAALPVAAWAAARELRVDSPSSTGVPFAIPTTEVPLDRAADAEKTVDGLGAGKDLLRT